MVTVSMPCSRNQLSSPVPVKLPGSVFSIRRSRGRPSTSGCSSHPGFPFWKNGLSSSSIRCWMTTVGTRPALTSMTSRIFPRCPTGCVIGNTPVKYSFCTSITSSARLIVTVTLIDLDLTRQVTIPRTPYPILRSWVWRYWNSFWCPSQPARCRGALRAPRWDIRQDVSLSLSSQRDRHGLHLGVAVERLLAQLAAEAAPLEPAERSGGVEDIVAVDPEGPRADAVGDGVRLADVAGPDGGGQAVLGRVPPVDDLIDVVELQDRQDRPEDLLAGDRHAIRDVVEDRRLDEEALVAETRAAGDALGPLCIALVDVRHDRIVLVLIDLGSLFGFWVERIAHLP